MNTKQKRRSASQSPAPAGAPLSAPDALDGPTAQDTPPVGSMPPEADGDGSGSGIGGATAPKPDPFDPASLRLSQNFAAAAGVRKLVTAVPVRKPSREWFVRCHPDAAYHLQTAVVELKEDREIYLVDPVLWSDLESESTFGPRLLVTSISRQGVLFLWPIRLPGPDGRLDAWNRSALEAAEHAKSQWVRVSANMNLGAYDIHVAPVQFALPTWPDLSFREILAIAFRDRRISSMDHPALRRLRGEM